MLRLKDANRKGYRFLSMYSNYKWKNKVDSIDEYSRKDITLYAKWNKIKLKSTKIKKIKHIAKQKIKLAKIITKLKKGKTYCIKACAYKLDSQGNKICSSYSKNKSVNMKQ